MTQYAWKACHVTSVPFRKRYSAGVLEKERAGFASLFPISGEKQRLHEALILYSLARS
jgi:hypothetical protein